MAQAKRKYVTPPIAEYQTRGARERTAQALGIKPAQVDGILAQILEKDPGYIWGYEYNRILLWIVQRRGKVKI